MFKTEHGIVIIVFFFAFFSFSKDTDAEQRNKNKNAPFGFSWGMNQKQIKSMGINFIEKETIWRRAIKVKIDNAPKKPTNTDYMQLFIDPEFGLVKILWVSNILENDPEGIKGKKLYDKLKQIMTYKYGIPKKEFEKTGVQIYKKADEFYKCLQDDACGFWYSYWELEDIMNFNLTLEGISDRKGRVVLSYEGNDLKKVQEAVKSEEETDKKNAF